MPLFFTVEPINDNHVVVHFAPICNQDRTPEYDDALADLVDEYNAIACDLSQTRLIASDWLRWLDRLSIRADKLGKKLVLAGVKANVDELTDILSLKHLVKVKSIEEVWES